MRGNNVNALHCILTASRTVEPRFKDIVLVSLASIYLEMGYFDEALGAAEEAFKLSLYEVSFWFLDTYVTRVEKTEVQVIEANEILCLWVVSKL